MSANYLSKAERYVKNYFTNSFGEAMRFHNLQHVQEVVEQVRELGREASLSDLEMERALLAAWFHDTGLALQSEGHEEASAELAEHFLSDEGYSQEGIAAVKQAILGTCLKDSPEDRLGKILRDADTLHLGKENFAEKNEALRQEVAQLSNKKISEAQFLEETIQFYHQHQFITDYAQREYGPAKAANLKKLKQRAAELNPETSTHEPLSDKKPKKKEKKKEKDLEKGIQTMFRNAQRTHIQLSAIADNKANIMLSVNAIILSVVMSSLVPKINTNPDLLYPTLILVLISLISLVFAILAVKPSVTHGRFTVASVKDRSANLLFFGNFHNMNQDDFEWGMMTMMEDSDFLYSSMIRDFHNLGIVLAQKYRYLRICYEVFMYGFILAALTFLIPVVQ